MPINSIIKHSKSVSDSKPQLAFSYNNTISSTLVSNKDKNRTKRKAGVYRIPCKDCDKSYFGETGRNLETRIEEHKRACRLGHNNSMVAKHTIDVGHRIDWNKTDILYYNNNVGKRRVLEGALINLCQTIENNKSFTQEDRITNFLVCKTLRIEMSIISGTPTARVPLLSPSQVLAVDDSLSTGSNAGADAGTPTTSTTSIATSVAAVATTSTTAIVSGRTGDDLTTETAATACNNPNVQPPLRRSTRLSRNKQPTGIT